MIEKPHDGPYAPEITHWRSAKPSHLSRRALRGWARFKQPLTCEIAHEARLGRDTEECPSRSNLSDTGHATDTRRRDGTRLSGAGGLNPRWQR